MGLSIRFESSDGHTVDVNGGESFLKWKPLNLTKFREGILSGQPLSLSIHDANTSVIGPETNFSGERDVEFLWRPPFAIRVFTLVPSGWLPAAFCESTLLLPDANLAGSFSLLDDEASKLRAVSGLTEVSLLSMGTNRISATLAAFESGQGNFPSYGEFSARVKSIALRLQRGFPGRQVVFPNHDVVNAGYAVFQEEFPAYKRNAAYLARTFSFISHRVDDTMLPRRYAELDALAAQWGVSPTSFAHLLVVDCLYDEGPRPKREQRPGRLVLKPKKVFKDADLFNVLTDIMHMERLCKAHLMKKDERPVLCTMDHGLVQAWAMLGPHNIRLEGSNPSISLRLDDSFAFRLTEGARYAFFEKLRG
jgi:hypothetical protein